MEWHHLGREAYSLPELFAESDVDHPNETNMLPAHQSSVPNIASNSNMFVEAFSAIGCRHEGLQSPITFLRRFVVFVLQAQDGGFQAETVTGQTSDVGSTTISTSTRRNISASWHLWLCREAEVHFPGETNALQLAMKVNCHSGDRPLRTG